MTEPDLEFSVIANMTHEKMIEMADDFDALAVEYKDFAKKLREVAQ
jgi:hypothetical protein